MPGRRSDLSAHTKRSRYPAPAPPARLSEFAVVGIGASAGGLEAVTHLAEVLPDGVGMAFILVQHLDPNRDSMMVELLTGHTGLIVQQATNGMVIERDHFYVIPPGMYLSVRQGTLLLSPPQAQQGARLPFDFLLHSLAEECGRRAICIVLSGTGADGAQGVRSIKARNGMVIAQEPREAAYDGMPRSAIMTGCVDLVLPVAKIPYALIRRAHENNLSQMSDEGAAADDWPTLMAGIIELLRLKTPHDFTFYKTGTLRRRIERRMAMAGIAATDMAGYLDLLRADSAELGLLGNDLLINVTRFFRDTDVFEYLANSVVGDIVRSRGPEQPIRIWIAGCSTGEETYSIAILFEEEMARAGVRARLQILSSDVDPEAVAIARDGLYSHAIEDDVSEARLQRFFIKEAAGYRIKTELRSVVAFTVHDFLSDPPFSRIDLMCCRNLLIYLLPEAQAKVIGLLHFALREGGVLLLGQSESLGSNDGRFAVINKSARIYRRVGRSRPGALSLPPTDANRIALRLASGQTTPRRSGLAELCRNLVLENYAPAALLINRRHECLYSLGPINRYIQVAPGHPTFDLLAMVRPGLRLRLRTAIERACEEKKRLMIAGDPQSGARKAQGVATGYSIAIQPVQHDGEELVLVCFIATPASQHSAPAPADGARARPTPEILRELEATKAALADALRNLETSSEEQNAIHQEALSVNEEFQSTNEELLTSKEELQSLNEELTAHNGQLHETLERQRTLANDLQNILYSTETATLFLDTDLNIRFFTPATRAIFHVIASDIGRPLADLTAYAADPDLLRDARTRLQTLTTIEQEIEGPDAVWYLRRVLPYRTHEGVVAGVVITFSNVTERKRAARALEAARRDAEQANLAKSRFLAAASHDLRQPLQTLSLLQGLLAKRVEDEATRKLVGLLDPTLTAISGMLNTLLDINQIDAGTVRAEVVAFPIVGILDRLRDEFTYHAQAQGLRLRVVRCSLTVLSDARLLEQMIRNLLSNAFKYTPQGAVLLGCRRRDGGLRIEVWDTGIGIPDSELEAIFAEYHQIDSAARERSRGLGLGLPIVRRLGELLGHTIDVRSRPGKGSVFAITVMLPGRDALAPPPPLSSAGSAATQIGRSGVILVIEGDAEISQLLDLLLTGEGHRVVMAADGAAALGLLRQKTVRPDLILADYHLPNRMNGLEAAARLRQSLGSQVPVIVLTGHIATDTLAAIAAEQCVQVSKPVKPRELTELIARLLVLPRPDQGRPVQDSTDGPVVYVVDDDAQIRNTVRRVLEANGNVVVDFASCEAFLEAWRPGPEACLLIDAYLPGMGGLQLLSHLAEAGHHLPAIMITGNSDVAMAVAAMKTGAIDFIEKPFAETELLDGIARAMEFSRDAGKLAAWRHDAIERLAGLTQRQRAIMDRVLAGQPSKSIAADLGISQRAVETHRAAIMRKTGAASLAALARLALAATQSA